MEECQMSDISFQVLEQARYADGGAALTELTHMAEDKLSGKSGLR